MTDDTPKLDSEDEGGYVPPAVEDLDAEDGPAVTAAGLSPSPAPLP